MDGRLVVLADAGSRHFERWPRDLGGPDPVANDGGPYHPHMTAVEPRSGPRTVRAPRGTELSCKGWQQEAALRMLMNNLDPEVAEDPDNLVVYGGTGRAARSWEAFDAIVAELQRLENDETLLVQSGKPVGVFRTTPDVPRVLIANANLVPHWATWEKFRELERAGPDDVRPDDGRVVDLHRDAGHHPGHVRDVRRGGRASTSVAPWPAR